jgi:hypothetical protein
MYNPSRNVSIWNWSHTLKKIVDSSEAVKIKAYNETAKFWEKLLLNCENNCNTVTIKIYGIKVQGSQKNVAFKPCKILLSMGLGFIFQLSIFLRTSYGKVQIFQTFIYVV